MNPYFAIFNSHINNALERTQEAFIKRYNQEKYDKYIDKYIENGIMSIFDDAPNEYTTYFVNLIHAFVNENNSFVRFEYDLNYSGGDYLDVGNFVYIPYTLFKQKDTQAFQLVTGFDPIHIIHYSPDELYEFKDNEFKIIES